MTQPPVSLLLDAASYSHPVDRVELVETHVSWVFLAGDYAYKIKKPVHLPFLDFSTLAARRIFCEEELRLNRRTAPDIYLEVLPIAGPPDAPRIGGDGQVIEYALKMRRFSQDDLADRVVRRRELGPARVDALAAVIADFHARIPAAPVESTFGTPGQIADAALENFEELTTMVSDPAKRAVLEHLRAWTGRESARLKPIFEGRRRDGFVRECHGDLHLGNIFFDHDTPVLFDCIEFNPGFRWIDVISEVAFLVMDLREHGEEGAARRLLNAYLEISGDYQGLRVFDYYLVYRAMVRAKVAMIRLQQAGADGSSSGALEGEYAKYAGLAGRIACPDRPYVVLMHGLAGSGKSTVSRILVEQCGAIRVRSDVERKRLHGLSSRARTHAQPHDGIYAPDTTQRTYDRLKNLARDIVESGHGAIVDAAFLRRAARDEFVSFVRELGVPVMIVSCQAPHDELRRRVRTREAALNDASEAGITVLENQILTEEPLAPGEMAIAVNVDAESRNEWLADRVEEMLAYPMRSVGGNSGLR